MFQILADSYTTMTRMDVVFEDRRYRSERTDEMAKSEQSRERSWYQALTEPMGFQWWAGRDR